MRSVKHVIWIQILDIIHPQIILYLWFSNQFSGSQMFSIKPKFRPKHLKKQMFVL